MNIPENDNTKNESARCCGNCARFFRDPKSPGHGWCAEWAGVYLEEHYVCEPYVGRPKKDKAKAKQWGAK